jgi:threonylcarbamoyladenosine tRNA methylthiotransferase MtaB
LSARIITFGCRLNANESQAMEEHAQAARLDDAVIVNTCAVTGEAVRQARQAIRRARRDNPGARIIVTGCAAQTEAERFAEMAEVDHVVGNAEKMQAATFERLSTDDAPRVLVNDIMSVRETAGHMLAGFGGRARAFVQIQKAAITAAPSASSRMGAGRRARYPLARSCARSRRSPNRATARWCSPAWT